MSVDFDVRGQRVDPDDVDGFRRIYGGDVGYQERGQVQVAGVDRDSAEPIRLAGNDDDIVEIEDAEGVVSFARAGTLADRARRTTREVGGSIDITSYLDSQTRGDGGRLGVVRRYGITLPHHVVQDRETLAAALTEAGPTVEWLSSRGGEIGRGALDIDLSGGMIAGLLPKQLFTPVARAAAIRLAEWVDTPVENSAPAADRRRKAKRRGVYRVGSDLLLEPPNLLVSPQQGDDKPYLLLLHGTFSHTEGAFGQLRDSAQWRKIAAEYDDRILAVEHATLSLSPVQNALMAAQLVPEGARLHLLSHSRGGLVGDALCYAAHQDPWLAHYPADHPDLGLWDDLRATVRRRGISVERFARVACPGRGTTLLSEQLDRVATVLFNVFKLVPFLRETGIAAVVQKFLSVFLEQRTDPRVIPGLEAQIPGSPFLLTLMAAQPGADNGLGNIVGDIEPSGIGRRLLVWVADRFYGTDHDLVVPTPSMDGGMLRDRSSNALFKGKTVDHSHYFGNLDSRGSVQEWLGSQRGATVQGFRAAADSPPQRGLRAPGQPLGEILLIPDAFGSQLDEDGHPGWPDVTQLVRIGLQRAIRGWGATTTKRLAEPYAPLEAALAESYSVTAWPYDPRRSLLEVAQDLRRQIEQRLSGDRVPHLVTHGTGALIALAALAGPDGPDRLEQRWREKGGQAVLLGPPLGGSWLIAARLAGRDELTTALALLDTTATPADVGQWFRSWRVLDALLPGETAEATRRQFVPQNWAGISAIFGTSASTVSGRQDDFFQIAGGGDGFNPGTGSVRGPRTWHSPVSHAELPSDADVATAVLDLLAGGIPSALVQTAPAGPTERSRLLDLRGRLMVPTAKGIVVSAWGGARRAGAHLGTLRLRIIHGDLRAFDGTTIIGHQDGTSIGGAERAADQQLGGALQRRLDLGQYPGRLGTSAVIGCGSEQVVVVGLGDAGDLTPKELTAGITRAVLKLAAGRVDRAGRGERIKLSLSSVLLGATLIPPMPVENSMNAIVQGVRQANRRLRDVKLPVYVDDLTIVELYEERAIGAVRAAAHLAEALNGDHDDQLVVERRLVDGYQGRPGLPPPDYYQSDQWRTVRIVAAGSGDAPDTQDDLSALSFTSIGRSARAEQQVNLAQRKLIDALITEAVGTHAPDPQILNTLYELLVPNSLKFQGYGSENLMLLVDRQSGSIPLEMLATRPDDQQVQPLAVDVGVVRRLETRSYVELSRRSSGRAALVIGDPAGTGLSRLDGARAEAALVRDTLTTLGYKVTSIIPEADDDQPQVVQILNALHRRDYRVVHISGHGHYDTDPTRSGVVIGPDTFLSALEIAQMRAAPDLVFLNCCHVGALDVPGPNVPPPGSSAPARPNRLASSISQQLIENGVQAVVAAGWAVDDEAAKTFADVFYRELLAGNDLGHASLRGRQSVYRRHGTQTNTWGAYQVWGPPAYRLDKVVEDGTGVHAPVARREFRDRLENLKNEASDATMLVQIDRLAAELQSVIDQVPPDWLAGSDRILVGDIWTQLARYREAEETYEKVRTDWSAEGSLKAVEQLANVRAKWAVQAARGGDRHIALDRIQAAMAEVELLIRVGRTPERLAIRGSIVRRLALCIPPTAHDLVDQALALARDDYQEAADMYLGREDSAGYSYPALNAALLDWLVHQRQPNSAVDQKRDRTALPAALAASLADKSPDFWARVADADARYTRALVEGSFETDVDGIEEAYRAAFVRSSHGQRVAVLEHLDIVMELLPERARPRNLADLRMHLADWVPDQ